MKDELGTVEYASMLYDFYGALLSESQREVMALYHEDNLSLSEIAEELSQSRQAVHYSLKRAESALAEFEAKLGLVKTYRENQALADKALRLLEKPDLSEKDRDKIAKAIGKLSE